MIRADTRWKHEQEASLEAQEIELLQKAFQILELSSGASDVEVRNAYLKLAKRTLP